MSKKARKERAAKKIEWQKEFAYRVTTRREMLNLTKTDLSNISGVSYNEIVRCELGEVCPRVDTVLAIASALNIDPIYLIKF